MATKEASNYRTSEDELNRCGGCVHFSPPNACAKVDGEISDDGVCDLFEPKANPIEEALFGGMLPDAPV